MSMPVIEKGIQMPKRIYVGRPTKYPIESMEVGDSFFVHMKADNVRSGIHLRSKKLGIECYCASVEGGTRVWRTK